MEDKPSLLVLRSHIATPTPTFTDDHEAHGYALKDDDIAATKEVMGLPTDETFHVPDDVVELYRSAGGRGAEERDAWRKRLEAFDGDRAALDACWAAGGLAGWADALPR